MQICVRKVGHTYEYIYTREKGREDENEISERFRVLFISIQYGRYGRENKNM